MIVEPDNEVFLSPASVWEIVIKHGLGRLLLKQPPDQYVIRQRRLHRIDSLVIDVQTVLHIGKLPGIHRDPFDRLLVAQAIIHECLILTPDPLIRLYPARVIW
jgi:PIN domain nuclease of toxin-antitoxin system